jgi:hypothetical protein
MTIRVREYGSSRYKRTRSSYVLIYRQERNVTDHTPWLSAADLINLAVETPGTIMNVGALAIVDGGVLCDSRGLPRPARDPYRDRCSPRRRPALWVAFLHGRLCLSGFALGSRCPGDLGLFVLLEPPKPSKIRGEPSSMVVGCVDCVVRDHVCSYRLEPVNPTRSAGGAGTRGDPMSRLRWTTKSLGQ